jgi:hypothetical protein
MKIPQISRWKAGTIGAIASVLALPPAYYGMLGRGAVANAPSTATSAAVPQIAQADQQPPECVNGGIRNLTFSSSHGGTAIGMAGASGRCIQSVNVEGFSTAFRLKDSNENSFDHVKTKDAQVGFDLDNSHKNRFGDIEFQGPTPATNAGPTR